jgi:hypothetical protein
MAHLEEEEEEELTQPPSKLSLSGEALANLYDNFDLSPYEDR